MNTPVTTFVTPDGAELVIITREEYARLLACADNEVAEDVGTARVIATTSSAITRGEDVAIPEDIWDAIEAGASPLVVFRKWRDMTQLQLGHRTSLSQSYISQLEAGAKKPSLEALKELAQALHIPLGVLADTYGQDDR